nr:MAG: hypothetical protein [Bacteriophage sp.]
MIVGTASRNYTRRQGNMNETEYVLRIKELVNIAEELANDDGICKSYRLFLFLEILAKPRYSRMSIRVKHLRIILKKINE